MKRHESIHEKDDNPKRRVCFHLVSTAEKSCIARPFFYMPIIQPAPRQNTTTDITTGHREPDDHFRALVPHEVVKNETSPVHSPLGKKPDTRSAVTPRSSTRQREQPWSLSPVYQSSVHQVLSSHSSLRSLSPLQASTVQNWWSTAVRNEAGGWGWWRRWWG